MPMTEPITERGENFIRRQIADDLQSGKHQTIITRFPPEPNGYLHIGHAKSICLNFGIAEDTGGKCFLRFDDTNPEKESAVFAEAICEDVKWLGYRWHAMTHASDYFDQLYQFAVDLINKGLAYVDGQTADEIRANRGTLTQAGKNSRDRDRPIAENLQLFAAMKNGEVGEGEMVLRAKIDMASPNINLRDPVLYRIRDRRHQRSGDNWRIYPLYDFTHGQSDAIEGVTHSLCTLEFEDHRALYDWFLDNLDTPSRPRQIEFSRLNLNYTVMSKRLLTQLVDNGDVGGWDDPRMPTLCGLRRRGFPPESIRRFIDLVGVTRKDNLIDMSLLENCVREQLDPIAPRAMAVASPLKLVIENYPADQTETITAPNHPKADMGMRELTLSREIYIDRDDFHENPPKKFFRLCPGGAVRLRYAYVVHCTEVIKDAHGRVIELRCRYDPDTRHGAQPASGKVKGIIHWLNAQDAVRAELRLYDRLFSAANPLADKSGGAGDAGGANFRAHLNPDSLRRCKDALVEPALANPDLSMRWQFERLGYFYPDRAAGDGAGNVPPKTSPKMPPNIPSKMPPKIPVFNRIATLRDSWARIKDAAQSAAA